MSSTNSPTERWSSNRVATAVRDRITSGEYRPGSRLPGRRVLMTEFETADRTVAVAMQRLRDEGLIYVVPGGGWYVRKSRGVVRSTRNRLSRAERAAGRGTFSSDCHTAGLTPDVDTEVGPGLAPGQVAGELDIEPGAPVIVRDRIMRAEGEVLQLATSYLPADLAEVAPAVAEQDSGPGGIYARLDDAGLTLTEFVETVVIGRASEHEARQMDLTPGDPVYRITRVAWTADRAVETNHITITGDRYELRYELPAE